MLTKSMVSHLPKFRPRVDINIRYQHTTCFGAEMLQCTNENKIRSRYVNILHLSTDLSKGKQEINKISQFMKDEGYDVKHQPCPEFWRDVDVLIIGSDKAHLEDVKDIINRLFYVGLVPHWDVLCYGIGYDSNSVLPLKDQVLYSNRLFSTRGMCIVFAHIMRRDDVIVLIGLLAHMMKTIEANIDEILQTNRGDILQTNARYFDCKKKMFRDIIKNDGDWNSDGDLFLAAINLLQKIRNVFTHTQNSAEQERDIKIWTEQAVYFCNVSKKLGYKFVPDFTIPITDANIHKHIKWEISIGRAVIKWIDDYKIICSTE